MAETQGQAACRPHHGDESRDKLRTATLRMLIAAIQSEEVSGKAARELTDADVLKVLARESKKSAARPPRSTSPTAAASSPPTSAPRPA